MGRNFALIGVGGYVAARHLNAIKETGNNLLAAIDKHDSVGIMDSYFPEADFFTEFERFDRHTDKLRRNGKKLDYVSICSPNYLHDSHIRFALRNGADAICEKPLVLNPWNVDALREIEHESKQKINCILQLRLHPSVIELKKMVDSEAADKIYDIDLKYITSRGNWYHISWKGDEEKSGGVITNIGIHFFDMLIWIFGDVEEFELKEKNKYKAKGNLKLKKANVSWHLSVDSSDLPENSTQKTFRSLKIEDTEFEFSKGFTDLHTVSYEKILQGQGFSIDQTYKSIDLVHQLRGV